jgi:ABC-type Zn uptake system ZnuABC Zn-binding protein ZnuA
MPRQLAAAALVTLLAACSTAPLRPAQGDKGGSGGRIPVLTTISVFNSLVSAVGGKHVDVRNVVPVGASPENYQPSPQDVAVVNNARLLIENGAGLETWLQRTLQNASNASLVTVVCTDGLPVKAGNPHLWMDPQLAKRYVAKIRDALTQIDPTNRDEYARNTLRYDARLDALTREIAHSIAQIPPRQRTMIVFHNAWQYYNDRFGIRTVGAIELSPGQEPNPQYIAHLVDLAKQNQVRAIFAEPEYSPKLAQALARSANIRVVASLYDDSVGANPAVRDYISMLRYDTSVIVTSLR